MKMLNDVMEGTIAALDVGSSKVACLIADFSPDGSYVVRGVGHRACNGGVLGGAIVDMEITEKAIRASVDQAEKMAGTTVSDVILSFSGGEPQTRVIEVEVDVEGHAVTQADVDRAINQAKEQIYFDEDGLLHAFPAAYAVDGNYGTKPPVGMYGKKLGLAVLAVTVSAGPLKNLEACVRRAHLNVRSVVLAPYAAGLASLVDDEMKMGAACIDLGGGTTGISVYAQGALVHAEILPLGGAQITEQVARNLLTPIDEAERLKTFHGCARVDATDEHIEIEVPQVGEVGSDRVVRMKRSALTSVVEKELELLFTTIAESLDQSGFSGVAGRRVVLTGGSAQCEAVRDLASRILGRHVRIGRPQKVAGLPVAGQAPNFAVAVGLLEYAAKTPQQIFKQDKQASDIPQGGAFSRVMRWIKDSF